jgi:hypothetical protein
MIQLPRLTGDLFAAPERPLEDLSAGLRDHFIRLKAYPHGGAFAGIIATTDALMVRWNAAELGINTGQNTQQGGRLTTDDDRDLALNRLRRNQAALEAIEDAATRADLLQLLYPNGLEAFTTAKVDALAPLLDAYLTLVAKVDPAKLPADFAARTTADLAAYSTTRATQISQQADTTRARQKRLEMVDEVTGLLTDNFHFLCLHFRTERGQVLGFFNRRYFEADAATAPDEATPPPTPPAGG